MTENLAWGFGENRRGHRSALREVPNTVGRPASSRREVRGAALILNTRSRAVPAVAPDLLRSLGVPVKDVYAVEDPAILTAAVREALSSGRDLILVGGGDESVIRVVDLLVHGDATLGLLPTGAANDFARTLSIPLDLEEACATVAGGVVARTNLGLAGNNHFLNVASVGSAEVTADFAAALSFPDGDHEPVAIDGLSRVTVVNRRHHAGADGAALDIYAVEAGDPTNLSRTLRPGEPTENEHVHHWRTRRVLLATDPPLPLDLDGEPVSRTPKALLRSPGCPQGPGPQSPDNGRVEHVAHLTEARGPRVGTPDRATLGDAVKAGWLRSGPSREAA